MSGKAIDMIGRRFGRLLVTARDGSTRLRKAKWRCLCDCGSERSVAGSSLRGDHLTRSCGCLIGETASITHKESGESRCPEYRTWDSMLRRCREPKSFNYAEYGGRGISVCERWNGYQNFLADMGRRPGDSYSIDRIDNDGNYEPINCRWATKSEQRNNQRPARRRKKAA